LGQHSLVGCVVQLGDICKVSFVLSDTPQSATGVSKFLSESGEQRDAEAVIYVLSPK
jgi:hypothetical protein